MADKPLPELTAASVASMLGSSGLVIDHGLVTSRVRSGSSLLAAQISCVYRHFRPSSDTSWIDLDLRLEVRRPWLRPWRPAEARLACDGRPLFDPFAADAPLPLLEWGSNWLIARRMNHVLLLHAGVLERGSRALVLPAMPGSGKSTLTAALSLSGWRLLSDEFGAFDPHGGVFHAVLKPVGLKNASIGVIRRFASDAELGPEFARTHKGTVAHLAPSAMAVERVHETARPGAIVLPKWRAGVPTRLERVRPEVAFSALAFNAFNYAVLGELGFRSALRLARECSTWQLVYSDLEDALRSLERLWSELPTQGGDIADAESPSPLPAPAV